MGKIIYIMGKSSCGKDTLYKKISSDKDLNLKKVVGYTTRPIREGETHGIEYNFVTKEIMDKLRLIEKRCYNTVYGEWIYATADDGNIDLRANNYVVIGTLESYEAFVKYFGQKSVVPIYIDVEDGERLIRAIRREQAQAVPKYTEMCRRYIADQNDFSEENIKRLGIEKRYYNNDLEQCFTEIKRDIINLI